MKYYEILPTHTETPRNTTRKIANLYIEFNYHFLTLPKKIPLLLNRSVHSPVDFSYTWRGFHRTPYGLAEPGDSGLGWTLSRGTIYLKTAMTQVLDFLWGSIQYEDFCVFGANWDGPVWSPMAWKNKRPRPVAVLIPGYNICKICDDASLSYFRRIFWKSLFRHFPDSPDVGFGGLTLVPYGLPGLNGDTKLLIWPLPLIYVKTAMTQVLDFVLKPNCTFACWFLL